MSNFNQRVLLFGGNGWIGSKVFDLLTQMGIHVVKSNYRADNVEHVDTEIRDTPGLTHVMSFIGRTHGVYNDEEISTIDYLEKPGKLVENIRDNLYSPVVLASICKKYGKHFTYLGTGCIFNYDDDQHLLGNDEPGFSESDLPNFFGSSYSIVKGFTDRLMHDLYNSNVLNVRIRMPITSEVSPRNFITKITNYRQICSMPNSMSVLDNLLPVMIDYAILNFASGTINLTNPGVISHDEILTMYNEIVDPNFVWTNFSMDEQDAVLASKRSNNCLDTTRLLNNYPNRVLPIKDAIREVLVQMRENINMNASQIMG